jgi:polyhydroxyalkanoate synthase
LHTIKAPAVPGQQDRGVNPETPTQRLDRLLHAAAAPFTHGLSPVSLTLAWADWCWHLAISPGRQMELAALASELAADDARVAAGGTADEPAGMADDDPRFRHPAWTRWPYSVLRHAFRNQEVFWRAAASAPGMTEHHTALTQFFARQWLGMLTPANWPATNPVVTDDALASGGAHLAKGALHWLRDVTGTPDPELQAQAARFVVGRDVAVTPGRVVFRNRLIELIRYTPQTRTVHPEPIVVIPSWIMKYYILDLSPHNSLVRYLVAQGHVVYMLSWRNPDARDHDLSMDDYLELGVFDALRAVARLHRGPQGRAVPVHAMGYCLGGTLLTIAAAALAHDGRPAKAGTDLPPLATLTLLAAQTDFSEPGELGLFIDESQIGYLDQITRGQGFLSGGQMAGSFQFLHSRDLVWTRRMREYLMGEREALTDLTAWNADTTRLPARMHHEYLTALYLHNALATSSYRVDGRAVSLSDLHQPVFLVGTERDHISPWRSVYKLHHLCDAEITFVLAAGGHNAGIVSEPGHANRYYRMRRAERGRPWVAPEDWLEHAARHEGSWWPAWHEWLAAHSSARAAARALPNGARGAALGPAPGQYVLQRYAEDGR